MDSIPSLQHRNSQDPSTSFLLSLPSEPPDVGNWFSSYEYKSPDPDSNVDFEDSAFKGYGSDKDEERVNQEVNCQGIRPGDNVVAGENLLREGTDFKEDKHNEDLSLAEDLDTFSSHPALLSEPPDIRNWFSSYAYETPMSGTSSLFEDSVSSEENGCEEKHPIFQEEDKYEISCENVGTGESLTHNSSPGTNTRINQLPSRGDVSVEVKKNTFFASTSHLELEKVLQPCMLQDPTSKDNVNPTKYEETISSSHGSAGCKTEQTLTSLDMDKNCTRSPHSGHKTDTKEATSKAKIEQENRDSIATISARVLSGRNSICLREKENGDMVSLNGFVTTKSRDSGAKDESRWKKGLEMSSHDSTERGRDSIDTKRKALGEVTNFQIHNDMEITGKWKCPRKGKPNVGPHLKQLRLEQWVHRN